MNDATANLSALFAAIAMTGEVIWRTNWVEICGRGDDRKLDAQLTAKALTPAQSARVDELMEMEPAEPSKRWAQLIKLGIAGEMGIDEDGNHDNRIELTQKGLDVANSPRPRPSRAQVRRAKRQQGWFPCGECGSLQAPGSTRCTSCGCM